MTWIPCIFVSVCTISWVLAMEFTERYPAAAFYDVGAGDEPDGGDPENVPVGLGPWGPSCGIPVP